jgi:RNA polymerase sigma factor (sigma-70 family)
MNHHNSLDRRLRSAEKDIVVPEPSAELLALQQEIARSSIHQEAQQIVEQAFAQAREEEPEDQLSSCSVMIPDSSMREMLPAQMSRLNERAVTTDLVTNRNSEYWQMCYLYVEHIIESNYHSDLTADLKEEVVQETLISAYNDLPKFRYERPFTDWLRMIVRSKMMDGVRQQRYPDPSLELLMQEDEDTEDLRVLSSSLEEIVLMNEQLRASLEALQAFLLHQEQREKIRMILQQVLIDGYTCEQTACLTGVSISTIEDTIRVARKYMKNALKEAQLI